MTRRRWRLIGSVVPALLAACVSVGLSKPPAPERYALDPPLPPRADAPGGDPTAVVVAMPRAAPELESRDMIYVQREHEIRAFARSAWVEPPARMLAPLLARALERAGTFDAVTDRAFAPPARLRLETDLLQLQQEFTVRPSRVRLVVRIRLVDVVARRVLGDRELEVVEPAPSEDAYGGVLAANAAAARVVADVADACASWVHQR